MRLTSIAFLVIAAYASSRRNEAEEESALTPAGDLSSSLAVRALVKVIQFTAFERTPDGAL